MLMASAMSENDLANDGQKSLETSSVTLTIFCFANKTCSICDISRQKSCWSSVAVPINFSIEEINSISYALPCFFDIFVKKFKYGFNQILRQ